MRFGKCRPFQNLMFLAGVILLTACAASASTRVDLDGFWQFKADPAGQGDSSGWVQKMPDDTEMVRVPGTWSILRNHYYYDGKAWYFKTFSFPSGFSGQRIEIHFGATFYRSRVWLNGAELGGHEGGYTAYYFDVTPNLRPTNYLAVEIDNRPSTDTIPGWGLKYAHGPQKWYDWWPQGGIIRDVWLKVSAPQLLRWQQILSAVSGSEATVTDHVHLENHSTAPAAAKLTLEAWGPNGDLAASSNQSLSLEPGSSVVTVKLRLRNAKRWSFDNPNLYRMEAILSSPDGRSLDSLTDNFGVRTIEIRNRRLYLNGEAVRLTGIDRHEDSPWEGVAETEGTILHDYDDLKNLQVTLTRPVHYPQNPRIYDFCDRHGILLIPEIPVWQFNAKQFADPKVLALAKQMMREVIEQDGNHPSIFAWSVCNESSTDTPEGVAYFRKMCQFIKSLDPSRYVTYADDSLPRIMDPQKNAASYADFVMWNEYYGSGHGPESLLPGLIEKIGRDYPEKMVIISESSPWTPLTPDPAEAREVRKASIGKELALFGKHPWIGGVLYWSYSPFRSHADPHNTRLDVPVPAPESERGNFEFVDQNRQRQSTYEAFQKYNSPAKIHLAFRWPEGESPASPPTGFMATIERRAADEIPSYPLDHYQAVWQAVRADDAEVNAGQQTLPEIGPAHTIEARWAPLKKARELTLHLWLYRPTGFLAAEGTCWWRPGIWNSGLWRCRSGE
jgi:beta-glucuronidase